MDDDATRDDLEAIHRVLSGDRGAFAAIVERYGDRLLRFLRSRLGSDEEAADAAQDVFLRAFASLRRFRLGESFPAWLFAIAANRARTRSLRNFRERAKAARAAIEAATRDSGDPQAEAEGAVAAAALREAVALLPEESRACVELYYFAGLSVAETARVLGLGEEAVKSRLFRARSRLREIIGAGQPGRGIGGIVS